MFCKHCQNLGDSPVAKQRQSLEDPYSTVEVDSTDDDAGDPMYAVVNNKTKGIRLVEEVR